MWRNWKTTLAGLLGLFVSVGATLPHVGHLGTTDFTTLGIGVATSVLGALSKDHDKTGVADIPPTINEHS